MLYTDTTYTAGGDQISLQGQALNHTINTNNTANAMCWEMLHFAMHHCVTFIGKISTDQSESLATGSTLVFSKVDQKRRNTL